MNKNYKELIAKKKASGKGKLEPIEAAAKHSVLGDLMGSLDKEGAKKVKGIRKVSVVAPDKKHLEQGLDIAKDVLKQGESEIEGGDQHDDHLLKNELEESPEYDDEESEEAMDDSPLKHIHEAEHNDPLSMHTENEELPEGADEEAAEEDEMSSMKKEMEAMKQEIARLKAPKSFY